MALETGPDLALRPSRTDGTAGPADLLTALRARELSKKLRGFYHSPDRAERTERVLHPYAIVYRGDAHYLVAYCELQHDRLTFRLDRFSELEVLHQDADIPDDFDPDEHFAGAWQVTGGRRHTVRLRFTGRAGRRLRGQSLHPTQRVLETTANGLSVEFHVAVTDEFRSWILSHGAGVEVISPLSLRREVIKEASQILANHPVD